MGRGDRKLKRGAWGEGKRKRAGDFFFAFPPEGAPAEERGRPLQVRF